VARAAAVFLAEELSCKNVGLLCLNDDFGETAIRLVSEYFDSVGISYVTETYGNDDKDMTTQILNLRNANVDGLLVWSYNDIFVLLARQLYELGMSGLPALNNGAVTTPDVQARMETEWYDGWYALAQWNPDDTEASSVKFKEDYTKEYGKGPNFLGACWYSATMWYLDCVEKAGSTDKDAVLAAMKKTKGYNALNGIYNWEERDVCKAIKIAQVDKSGKVTTLKVLTF
jgi:branched-chain amino acid transport system substrate-binding protein